MIAMAYAAPTPFDETAAGANNDDITLKADDLKQIIVLLKLKPLLLLG